MMHLLTILLTALLSEASAGGAAVGSLFSVADYGAKDGGRTADLATGSPLLLKADDEDVALSTPPVLWFDIDASNAAKMLTYEERALAFTLQGLVNRKSAALFYDAGFLDFDWPKADEYWRRTLEARPGADAVAFKNLSSSLCALIDGVPAASFGGAVLYSNAAVASKAYTLPVALTIAAQQSLLPLTKDVIARNAECLKSVKVVVDLTTMPQMQSRASAWEYAVKTLLPKSSNATVMNLYHDDAESMHDPQANATLSSLDYAVARNAFILDLQPSATSGDHEDDPAKLKAVLESHMAPLFDAFGWAHDEHAWTQAVSVAGGTVFCSFASVSAASAAPCAAPRAAPALTPALAAELVFLGAAAITQGRGR